VTARENIKKIRSLVRRLQNSGYLTLARLADHLDRLSAGDESNAVVDAVEAVNLMTVHGAKGLEFPVAFIVNLSRGSGGPRAPIRVAAHAEPEDAVAVGDFESAFDADEAAREREESKRLLYVALTRARDRLYFVSKTDGGALRPGKGSLGEVLPESIRALIGAASTGQVDGATVEWRASGGASHVFRVAVAGAGGDRGGTVPFAAAEAGGGSEVAPPADDFLPIPDTAARVRRAVTRPREAAPGRTRLSRGTSRESGVMLGRVVHRMFQAGVRGDAPQAELSAFARRVVPADDVPAGGDLERLAADAARMFAALWSNPDLRDAVDGADCHYEVPVSALAAPDEAGGGAVVLRGAIDCLAFRPDGRVMVVEFKTGARRASHGRQLRAYVKAVRAMLPGTRVDGRLVYAG
jgi:ATP-dependent exoDNAse (exonuclease V) beta subunit